MKNLQVIIEKANKLANPKAIYRKAEIKIDTKDEIVIDNICFSGKALKKCLSKTEFVFPFIATCGNEIDDLKTHETDFF